MLEQQKPATDQSYLGYNDLVDLFQSHLSLHYNRQYEDLRIIGVPVRFLKRLVFINEDDDDIAALSSLSPSKYDTFLLLISLIILIVLGNLLLHRSQPNALATHEIVPTLRSNLNLYTDFFFFYWAEQTKVRSYTYHLSSKIVYVEYKVQNNTNCARNIAINAILVLY